MTSLLITGATGLTGSAVIDFLPRNISSVFTSIYCTIYSHVKSFDDDFQCVVDYVPFKTDLSKQSDWLKLISTYKPDCVLIISNIRHTSAFLDALYYYNYVNTSVFFPRLIVVGTTGVYSRFLEYSSVYSGLESAIRVYPGSFLVLRPAMIFGSKRDKNIHKVLNFISRYKFYPVFGDGSNLMQPVHYSDLAKCIVNSLLDISLTGFYNLPGRFPQTYANLIRVCFEALSIKPRIVYIPTKLLLFIFSLTPPFLLSRLPFTREQVRRLSEDKSFEYNTSVQSLDYSPLSFEEGIILQVRSDDF